VLRYRQDADLLVLMQDAVVADDGPAVVRAIERDPPLCDGEDLKARGLSPRIGMELDMAGLIKLIAEQGSPQTWAG
jgi:tRNA 2-thiouridine synthesizing protein B